MVEMQFSDFVTCGFNQIVNNLAKIHWRWGQKADVVVRMPTGVQRALPQPKHGGVVLPCPRIENRLPFHPGRRQGPAPMAIDDPNPVLFFEHKYLYRNDTSR